MGDKKQKKLHDFNSWSQTEYGGWVLLDREL
jgi:hypothetical protein